MKKRIRLLLFDLDDTLWPCMPVVRAAEAELYCWLQENVDELARKYSLEELREHRIDFARGQPDLAHDISRVRTEAFRSLARELGLGEQWIEPAFEVFLEARQRVTPYPDVFPVLEGLSGAYELAAVTNGNADVYRTPLGKWFSFSISAADAGARKPEPAILELALEKAGVDVDQSVLIGDDEHRDMYAAAQLGMESVWVNREGRDWAHFACTTEHHIRDLYELPGLLEHLQAQVGYNP